MTPSVRPAHVRAAIRNDDRAEHRKLIDDLDAMIMEEVERQPSSGPGPLSV